MTFQVRFGDHRNFAVPKLIVDAHAHLDDNALTSFVDRLGALGASERITIFSNSVDYSSSLTNLDLAKRLKEVKAFVGIHPEIFSKQVNENVNKVTLDEQISLLAKLLPLASGVGEIGLDEKYGSMDLQEYLLREILGILEQTNLPSTFHCRGSVDKITQLLSTYNIRGNVLFHWFAGSETELRSIQQKGMYVSFGPSILYSRRLGELARISNSQLTLIETDAPTRFEGITGSSPGTPFLAASVIFKLGMLRGSSFLETLQLTSDNALRYLKTQH